MCRLDAVHVLERVEKSWKVRLLLSAILLLYFYEFSPDFLTSVDPYIGYPCDYCILKKVQTLEAVGGVGG